MKNKMMSIVGRSAGAAGLFVAWMGCFAVSANAAEPSSNDESTNPAAGSSLTVDVVPTRPAEPVITPVSPPFERIKVRENFYVLSGPDGNVGIHLGRDGVVVVDTQRAALGAQLLAEVKKLGGEGEIRWLINTNADPGHVGANESVRNAGSQLIGGPQMMAQGTRVLAHRATHIAQENVMLRLAESPSDGALPQDTYASAFYDFYFNGEAVFLIHAPAAHSDGDSLVHFRASDVVMAGEVWNTLTYPVIDTKRGGSIQGELNALNTLIEITVPREKQEGGTLVIPGRGRIGDEAEIVDYRDMVTIIHDRIKAMVDKGMTLQQVKAAKPTADYDNRWGATSGPWTTDMFIAAVYEGVKGDSK